MKKRGEGHYAGNSDMGRESVRQSRATDQAGNPREPKRSVGEGPAKGYAAPLSKASFGGGAMSRPAGTPKPRKYIGG